MIVQYDSREQKSSRERITKQFDKLGIEHFCSKMYVGDYCDPTNPKRIVERKKSIGELALNLTVHHKRFVAELDRAKMLGSHITILIEENKIDGKPITELSDLILWSSEHTQIRGERLYRILSSLTNRYELDVCFCDKRSTGKRIVEILEKEN